MGKRWYVVHVFSGFEKKMKQAILLDLYKISNNPKDSDVLVEIEKLKKIKNLKYKWIYFIKIS